MVLIYAFLLGLTLLVILLFLARIKKRTDKDYFSTVSKTTSFAQQHFAPTQGAQAS